MSSPTPSSKTVSNTIKKAIRQLVWNRFIGATRGTGYCWCCNSTIITAFEFECGHVLARAEGGPDTVDNLRPICGLCNRSMGTENMLEFQKKHGLERGPVSNFSEWLSSKWNYFVG